MLLEKIANKAKKKMINSAKETVKKEVTKQVKDVVDQYSEVIITTVAAIFALSALKDKSKEPISSNINITNNYYFYK